MANSIATVRQLQDRLAAMATTDPSLVVLIDEVRTLLGDLEGDLRDLQRGIEVLERAIAPTRAIAAKHLRPGDGLHWQGAEWGVLGVEARDHHIIATVAGLDGLITELTFAAVEAVAVAHPRLDLAEIRA